MKNRKLCRVLDQVPEKTVEDLMAYLGDGSGGNSQVGKRFVACYLKWVRGGQDMSAKGFYQKLYPGGTLQSGWEANLNNLQSRLLKLVHDFLTQREFREDALARTLCEIRVWEKTLPPRTFLQKLKQSRDSLGEQDGFETMLLTFIHTKAINRFINANHLPGEDDQLAELITQGENLFWIENLKYACADLNRHLASPTKEKIGVGRGQAPGASWRLFQRKDVPEVIQAYGHCLQMLEHIVGDPENSKTHFEKLKRMLLKKPLFARTELEDLFIYALNFCTIQYNRCLQPGEAIAGYKQILEEMLKRGLFMEQGKIPIIHLKNTVKVMLDWGETGWVEEFLDRFKGKVIDDPNEIHWHLNLAVLKFASGEFRECLRILEEGFFSFPCKNDLYRIGARIYEIKCLFELESYELNSFRIESLRRELGRKLNIHRDLNEIYFRFCLFMRTLNNARQDKPQRQTKAALSVLRELDDSGLRPQFVWVGDKATLMLSLKG